MPTKEGRSGPTINPRFVPPAPALRYLLVMQSLATGGPMYIPDQDRLPPRPPAPAADRSPAHGPALPPTLALLRRLLRLTQAARQEQGRVSRGEPAGRCAWRVALPPSASSTPEHPFRAGRGTEPLSPRCAKCALGAEAPGRPRRGAEQLPLHPRQGGPIRPRHRTRCWSPPTRASTMCGISSAASWYRQLASGWPCPALCGFLVAASAGERRSYKNGCRGRLPRPPNLGGP